MVLDLFDTGNVSALVVLDLSAMFDFTDHDVLIHVLQKLFGVQDNALDWFRS